MSVNSVLDRWKEMKGNCNSILDSRWTKLALYVGLTAVARNAYCYIHRKYKQYPPGPVGYPFFGSLFSCIDIPNFAAYLGLFFKAYNTRNNIFLSNI